MSTLVSSLLCCLATIITLPPAIGQEARTPDVPTLTRNLTARCLGPCAMGGRITDVAVVESRPTTMFVATASGGVWKTTNNGTTWKPIFDEQASLSIGDIAVAPSDPQTIWVGTGEANARNSVSWGDGVYKSKDGGKSWRRVGLKETHHIGRIVVHPRRPDTVYVAAVGHFWGPSKERGLFKTVDGGKTWQNVNFISDDCGFIDLVMDPEDPETLFAAAFQVRRDGFSVGNPATQFSKASGIYKTTDGGQSWVRLTHGLPDRPLGRIGIDICRRDPRILYAVVPTDKTDIRTVPGQAAKTGDAPETGGIFRSEDRGVSWTKVNDLCPRPFYFGQIRVDPNDPKDVYVCGVSFFRSRDGGKTFRIIGSKSVHVDQHALWINPANSNHLVLGSDGGVSVSYDRGATWDFINNLPIAQFYGIAVDNRRPYWVYGGLQDNGTWCGPSATWSPRGIATTDWLKILGSDGFQCRVDPEDSGRVYAETQYGGLTRIRLPSGAAKDIKPQPPPQGRPYRFNWNAPLVLSPHDARTLYYGGNHVFRSRDRGDAWETISPDLSRGGPGTLSALAESPCSAGLLWAGTDDGRLLVTRDGGRHWIDLTGKLPDVSPERTISRIEPSPHDPTTAFVCVDRHRNEDYRPYIFKTSDGGESWQLIVQGLPDDGPVHVLRQDPKNREMLLAGTEFGLYLTLDGGREWHPFRAGMPRVAVHDLVIHPREGELVIGTHGRGIWIVPIAPLQGLSQEVLNAQAHFFELQPVIAYQPRSFEATYGSRSFHGENPPYGGCLRYYLREQISKPVQFVISDVKGKEVASFFGATEPGIHALVWNLRTHPAGGGKDEPSVRVPPGSYTVKMIVGGSAWTRTLQVESEAVERTLRSEGRRTR